MEKVCSSPRKVSCLGVFAKFDKIHLLLLHVISKTYKIKVRRHKDAGLLEKLASEVGQDLERDSMV